MTKEQIEAIALPHKLFAVLTAPDGKLYFRKMWSIRLVAYLASTGALDNKDWKQYIKNAEIGQVWNMTLDDRHSWMVLIRIHESEDKGDTV